MTPVLTTMLGGSALVPEPFALLMSTWAGDRPEHLALAFRSAVDEQTLRPDQVVIVRDGPVPEPLEECLRGLVADSPVPVTYVPLERNVGLGPALDAGLAASQHDIVARMDADDICLPNRFEVQLPVIAEADIVGAGLLEFTEASHTIVGRRTPPTEPHRIRSYARMHDPFNHPTVVYRRSAVLDAGGYGDRPLVEDYALFARMIAGGARVANVADPLVLYRVGEDSFRRRGGTGLLRSELRLQREFLRQGFVTRGQYLRNVAIRGAYRLIPWWLRRALYKRAVPGYSQRLDEVMHPVAEHDTTRPDTGVPDTGMPEPDVRAAR